MNSFVFGPVPSRRLGYSLGVDIIPRKYCNFDCIYCQIGKTTNKTSTRAHFFDPEAVAKQVFDAVQNSEKIDFVTFSGSGEPTLNENLGIIINELKKSMAIPLAVITNSSLLSLEDVRDDLKNADVVLPSLDAASVEVFKRINRPQAHISFKSIVNGLKAFRKQYNGRIWLEIMLIKGINDTEDELLNLKKIINNLNADKIHLNTVTRPPSEKSAGQLNHDELERIMKFFGNTCEIISDFEKDGIIKEQNGWNERIYEILKRRSLTIQDIIKITGAAGPQIQKQLKNMEKYGLIKAYRLGNEMYFSAEV